MEKVAKSRRNC